MNKMNTARLLLVLLAATAFAVAPFGAHAQLSPDPNPVGNTISLGTSLGMNLDTSNPYYNYGEIDVASGGTLDNNGTLNNVGTINSAGMLQIKTRLPPPPPSTTWTSAC